MAKGASDSKRWTHFHSALQLAINRAAHKWTHEDFQECFALWCKEEPHGAEAIFNTISRHMEDQIHASCETLFRDFKVRENVNIMHAVVTEARARKQRGETNRKDVWREDLETQARVRARIVPMLESEVERLKTTLKSLEEDNVASYEQVEMNVQRQRKADKRSAELLKILDDVYSKWSRLPHDEMSLWTLQTAENLATTQLP
ncbi:hypothetical protein BS17DRAFT_788798 [Gyrodon lividus]|nr:hypothetical protein BS17DRAFT_788798 [Gyrodon lividus]